ncbi:hypothetical protein [Pseudonocardia humida]|uniref:Uncharacterized protein n=1 Tax=Pseudonocardia humida TaxID=2800819 RepID=A0ABT1AB50_9PSEU|nr:hypothetical protein [Pseudonocardia humida]MCO1660191.1 hypothetical protein [Pseudonocardia humida]
MEAISVAHVHIDDTTVTVVLSWWERPFAGGRARMEVPRTAVREIATVDRPTRVTATGLLRSGVQVTGVLKVGRWGMESRTRRWVSVRRSVPALRISLDGERAGLPYDELLISTSAADADLVNGKQDRDPAFRSRRDQPKKTSASA